MEISLFREEPNETQSDVFKNVKDGLKNGVRR